MHREGSRERWTIGALLETVAGYLLAKGSSSPRLDAELLLAETLGVERIHLYTGYDRPLTSSELDRYRGLVSRRAQHEPVAYILGRSHFRHLCLEVTPAVLIPRPETEELVDAAMRTLRLRPPWETLTTKPDWSSLAGGESPRPLIADVGTGSGAIALSLAQETGLRVLAVDSSEEALAVAARNRAALGLDQRVELRCSDLLTDVSDSSLHLVVSNPPYVASADADSLSPDVRLYEPAAALYAGPDGLAVFRRLLPDAARVLMPGGSIILEVGDGQAAEVADLAREAGFALIDIQKDASQKDRIVLATLPGASVLAASHLDTSRLAALAAALETGAIIGLPTDTVYGLAARWDSPTGVGRLFVAKGRGSEQPVAVIFPSVASICAAIDDLDARSAAVLEALLPGPFTFVVTTRVPRPPLVGTSDSLGVRVPDHPWLLQVLASLGTPMAATSANLSGGSDPKALADVDPRVLSHCSLALADPLSIASDGRGGETYREGATGRGLASTVVDLRPLSSGDVPIVLREGAVAGTDVLARIARLF